MHDPECTCGVCREDSERRDGGGVDFARYADTLREYHKKVRREFNQKEKARKEAGLSWIKRKRK